MRQQPPQGALYSKVKPIMERKPQQSAPMSKHLAKVEGTGRNLWQSQAQ